MEVVIDYINQVAKEQWWRVGIELFLIGLVVYWVVDFLEGTRGERLFRSVIFILIVGVLILKLVGDYFGLVRLEYLYKSFLIFVLIIAVVGFQPEIRRVLIRIGQPSFLSSSSQQLTRTAEEIIAAIIDMSKTRTGAIIVIEKKVALGELIETGIRLEAKVSSELLKTIFRPGTALHDMAIIIRGDRIVAARVQLPLAEAGSTGGIQLGSRHRAAIGITTGSDATVLVVSEETGTISIATDGKLRRNVTDSQMRAELVNTIDQIAPLTERLWRFGRKNDIGSGEKTA